MTVNATPGVDAGTDGGALDGGALDAGESVTDGGDRGAPRVLTVSCGCTQGPGALGWFAALSSLATWRRRRD